MFDTFACYWFIREIYYFFGLNLSMDKVWFNMFAYDNYRVNLFISCIDI